MRTNANPRLNPVCLQATDNKQPKEVVENSLPGVLKATCAVLQASVYLLVMDNTALHNLAAGAEQLSKLMLSNLWLRSCRSSDHVVDTSDKSDGHQVASGRAARFEQFQHIC
jgi:hypothetical protein